MVPKGLVKLTRWYNGTDHFYTADASSTSRHHGYQEEGVARVPVPHAGRRHRCRCTATGTAPTTSTPPTTTSSARRPRGTGEGIAELRVRVQRSTARGAAVPLLERRGPLLHHRLQRARRRVVTATSARASPATLRPAGDRERVVQDVIALPPELADRTFEIAGTLRGESTACARPASSCSSPKRPPRSARSRPASSAAAARLARPRSGFYEARTPEAELAGASRSSRRRPSSPGCGWRR